MKYLSFLNKKINTKIVIPLNLGPKTFLGLAQLSTIFISIFLVVAVSYACITSASWVALNVIIPGVVCGVLVVVVWWCDGGLVVEVWWVFVPIIISP